MSIKLTQQEKLDILSKKNVVSVSTGYKKVNDEITSTIAIVIGVTHKQSLDTLDFADIIPESYNEKITDVIETDSGFSYLSPNCMDIDDNSLSAGCSTHVAGIDQAIKGGMQIAPDSGPNYGSVGTLGAICRDVTDNKLVGLTNSHVLGQILKTSTNIDSSNPYLNNFVTTSAEISNISICQTPGQPVFSQYKRTVDLEAYDITTGQPANYTMQTVDGAIIDLSTDNIGSRVVSPVIHSSFAATPLLNACPIYDFSGDITSLLGKRFIKVGRTTGTTPLEDNYTDIHGVIEGVDTAVSLNLVDSSLSPGNHQIRAIFNDCIKLKLEQNSSDVPAATANSSRAGDSGSCVFVWNNDRWEVIGLLFAGTTPQNPSISPSYTSICRIDHVMKALNIGDNWTSNVTLESSDIVQSQPPSFGISNAYYSEISSGTDCHLWDGSISCDSVSEYIEITDGDGQPLTYKRRDNTYKQANVHTHKVSSSNVNSITEDDLRSITLYVDSSQYHIDNSITRDIYISRLQSTYKFILPATTYGNYPLTIGTVIDDNSNAAVIPTTVTTSGNNKIISLNINDIDPSYKKIYYFCSSHNNMGGNIYILHNPYNGNATY